MKILYKYILKELAKPFFGSLIVIIMVLLSNFILKNIDKFLGKGISLGVVMKFIFLNSAWIFSLAVPMAILITTLMTFGRLASDNEITAFKASGITFFEILKPGILFGVMLITFMIPFNLWLLPEMNHSMKKLSYEISRSRPDVEFNEQLLNSLADKIIYVGKRLSNNSFNDIIIFDNKNINVHTTILSENGLFHALQDGIILDLNNGSIHEHIIESDEYRKTYFNNYKIAVPFKDLNINSDNLTRREREMNIHLLTEKITYYKDEIDKINEQNITNTETLDSLNQLISNLDKIGPKKDMLLYKRTQNKINKVNIEQKRNMKLIPKHKKEVYKYGVEVHKKFTLPFACLFFIFLGTPLGIMARKGNMSISIGVSLIFFIIYWSFLIIGENLADNGQLNPAIAMWLPNIIVGITAYYLYKMYSNENKSFKFNLKFLNKNKK
tara:strand:- start:247 stop:1566 length:1320 start_codon:yes stop_codon:yes gene_type:complete